MRVSDLQKRVVFLGDVGGHSKIILKLPKIFPLPGARRRVLPLLLTLNEHEHRIGYPLLLVDIIEESALLQRPCSVEFRSALGDLLRRCRRDIYHRRLAPEGNGCELFVRYPVQVDGVLDVFVSNFFPFTRACIFQSKDASRCLRPILNSEELALKKTCPRIASLCYGNGKRFMRGNPLINCI